MASHVMHTDSLGVSNDVLSLAILLRLVLHCLLQSNQDSMSILSVVALRVGLNIQASLQKGVSARCEYWRDSTTSRHSEDPRNIFRSLIT